MKRKDPWTASTDFAALVMLAIIIVGMVLLGLIEEVPKC